MSQHTSECMILARESPAECTCLFISITAILDPWSWAIILGTLYIWIEEPAQRAWINHTHRYSEVDRVQAWPPGPQLARADNFASCLIPVIPMGASALSYRPRIFLCRTEIRRDLCLARRAALWTFWWGRRIYRKSHVSLPGSCRWNGLSGFLSNWIMQQEFIDFASDQPLHSCLMEWYPLIGL